MPTDKRSAPFSTGFFYRIRPTRMVGAGALIVALVFLAGLAAAAPTTEKGKVQGISQKAKTIQLKTEDGVRIIRFDTATKLTNLKNTKKIKPGSEITIVHEERQGSLYAIEIKAKPLVTLEPGVEIKVAELKKIVLEGAEPVFTLVDARPPNRFAEGHLPGAVNIFTKKFDEQKDLLPTDKNQLVIFYCGGPRCGLSPKAAKKAKKLGYTNVRVYKMGEPDWRKRKLPIYSTPSYLSDTLKAGTGIVVVDVRAPAEVQAGHIPGAVGIPVESLPEAEDEFPSSVKAPIVIYGGGQDTAKADTAALAVKNWGYQRVSVLEGGFSAWLNGGFQAEQGPAATEITYVRKLGPGEISTEEFRTLAEAKTPNVVIVDCREPEEFKEAHIPGSINIPADDISARIGELPKDARVVTYCNTGVRAEMAFHMLKKAGYDTAFLNREVFIEKDGSFDIEE